MNVEELLLWFEIGAGIAIILGIITIFFLGKTLFEIKINSKKNSNTHEPSGTLFVLQQETALLGVDHDNRRVQIEEMVYSMYSHRKFATSETGITRKPTPSSKSIIVDSKEIRASYDKYALCHS